MAVAAYLSKKMTNNDGLRTQRKNKSTCKKSI